MSKQEEVVEKNNRLNLKSIQHPEKGTSQQPENQENKPRERPPVPQKDKVKKKRKLLSFGDQFQDLADSQRDIMKKSKPANQNQAKINNNAKSTLKEHKEGDENLEEDLKNQFLTRAQNLKQQLFEMDYSYWDGTSIIKKLNRKKNEKVENLLEICRLELIEHFQNLAGLKTTDLLFVVKDFIVPHNMKICDMEALDLKTAKGEYLLNFKNVKIKDLVLSVNMDPPVRIVEKAKYEKYIANFPFNTWRTISLA